MLVLSMLKKKYWSLSFFFTILWTSIGSKHSIKNNTRFLTIDPQEVFNYRHFPKFQLETVFPVKKMVIFGLSMKITGVLTVNNQL